MSTPFIELRNIHKQFCGMSVLSGINLTLHSKETHGLLGCNGAGKSTLVRILAGMLQPDEGEIIIEGKACHFSCVADSVRNKIAISTQELMLFENMSILDNLFMGNSPLSHQVPIRYSEYRCKAEEILRLLHLDIDPDRKVSELAYGEKFMIQFGRCYLSNPKLLVLDELSASLTVSELNTIHQLIHLLKVNGCAVLYITHRIQDILKVSDRITILRDGVVAATPDMKNISESQLRTHVFGDSLSKLYPKLPIKAGEKVLELSHISNKYFDNVSLELHSGEIYGILGLSGSGRSRLLRAIAGIDPIDSGTVCYMGKTYHGRFRHRHSRIAYIPEDRDTLALFKNMKTYHNISISNMRQTAPHNIIDLSREATLCRNLINRLGIHGSHLQSCIQYLSGGNKQKIVIARNLYSCCNIFLFDEPTQGIDTAGKVEVYNIISELARKGAAIIFVSSDFPELVGMCDRIITLQKGRVLNDLPANKVNLLNPLTAYAE